MHIGGIYDSWCSGGGDTRLIKHLSIRLNPRMVFRYLARPPFAPEAWIIAVNSCEDIIGGHYWISLYLILGGM